MARQSLNKGSISSLVVAGAEGGMADSSNYSTLQTSVVMTASRNGAAMAEGSYGSISHSSQPPNPRSVSLIPGTLPQTSASNCYRTGTPGRVVYVDSATGRVGYPITFLLGVCLDTSSSKHLHNSLQFYHLIKWT